MIATLSKSLALAAACFCPGLAFAQAFQPVTKPGRPIEAFGFSVLPPGGEQWFVAVDSRSETVVFGKRDPEFARNRGSLLVLAARMRARANPIDTAEGLKSELMAQIQASSARHTLLSAEVEPYRDEEKNTDCVRISTSSEERRNPSRPGEVLLMTVFGKACRQPDDPRNYVQVTVSERRTRDSASLLDDARRAECSRVVDSMQFPLVSAPPSPPR